MAKEKVVAVVVAKVVPDQVPVALEVARGMSAEIFCKGSAKGTIAVTGAHLLATTSKRAVAKRVNCKFLHGPAKGNAARESSAGSNGSRGRSKEKKKPKDKKSKDQSGGSSGSKPKKKDKRVKRGCCAEPCLFA